MSANYVIILVHQGLYDFAEDFIKSVRDMTKELFRQTHLVCFREEVLTEDQESSSLAVYLGSRSGRYDPRVKELLCQAVADQLPIFPIVRESDDGGVYEKIPAVIARINAANWTESRASVLTEILGILGLVDAERKVFLSYVRRETSPIALQLHKALVQNRFDVFLAQLAQIGA